MACTATPPEGQGDGVDSGEVTEDTQRDLTPKPDPAIVEVLRPACGVDGAGENELRLEFTTYRIWASPGQIRLYPEHDILGAQTSFFEVPVETVDGDYRTHRLVVPSEECDGVEGRNGLIDIGEYCASFGRRDTESTCPWIPFKTTE